MNDLFIHFPEIMSAVIMVLGGQKGYEIYRRKQYKNGNGKERRHNSLCDSDKTFIKECFNVHAKDLSMTLKNSRLELASELKDFIRVDGESTRNAVRN